VTATGDPPALAALLARDDVRRLRAALSASLGREAVVYPDEAPPRRAAVALVLRAGEGGLLELLFVKRAEYEGDPWSGHVAFPGGRHEPGDATPWDTAARETWEETGLDLRRDGRVLGTLDELHPRTPVLPSIVVRPHVVAAAPSGPLALSSELAAAFWMPLCRFAEAGVSTTSVVRARGMEMRVPSFVHEGHTIWGMTHRILQQLLDRVAEAG
jgi:8-oxo-dGTP pyrophosphatase MutT (NUDIX family)